MHEYVHCEYMNIKKSSYYLSILISNYFKLFSNYTETGRKKYSYVPENGPQDPLGV